MTRPQIIRADTLDLQDQHSPSASDHTRQPEHPAPLGIGPAAPHQQAAIKSVEDERAEQQWATGLRDEPGSDDETTVLHNGRNGQTEEEQRDELAVRQNGGISGAQDDEDMADAEVDDQLDDDMMDKISSSPSIDDGGCNISYRSPVRSRPSTPVGKTPSTPPMYADGFDEGESSPFLSTPKHLPLGAPAPASRLRLGTRPLESSSSSSSTIHSSLDYVESCRRTSKENHRMGKYGTAARGQEIETSPTRPHHRTNVDEGLEEEERDVLGPLISERPRFMESESSINFGQDQMDELLLPEDDPLLDNSFDDWSTLAPRPLPEPPKTSSPSGESDGWDTETDDSTAWSDDENDDVDSISFSDPRFVDSGWGGECLRETEDIDFEFVYALHTFVATVEGQANATKGDTMVLLDDSNSYWWLVRVVKDSTIGYLPAEHIETPTERLARLNKHRNIDLSATMLGDTAEKTKNPLKKAMRRRNAKTVTFNVSNHYVEASDYDYSSDEEEEDSEKAMLNSAAEQQAEEMLNEDKDRLSDNGTDDLAMKIEPLKINTQREAKPEDAKASADANDPSKDEARTSEDMFEGKSPTSRNGTPRNTDSFFKDDTVETRKITLTPNLLRDEGSTASARTSESKERKPSLESLEKDSPMDKSKDDKKKKEKKPGMLSGLFKRKEKKSKGSVDDNSDGKVSEELGRDSMQSKDSLDSPIEKPVIVEEKLEKSEKPEKAEKPIKEKKLGKLQKTQKPLDSSKEPKKPLQSALRLDSPEPAQPHAESNGTRTNGAQSIDRAMKEEPKSLAPETTPIMTPLQTRDAKPERPQINTSTEPAPSTLQSHHLQPTQNGFMNPFQPSPVSPITQSTSTNPFADSNTAYFEQPTQPKPYAAQRQDSRQATERLSESPVQVSPIEPPALVRDNSSLEDNLAADTSPSSSPSLVDLPPPNSTGLSAEPPTTSSSTSTVLPIQTPPPSDPPPARPAPTPREVHTHSHNPWQPQPLTHSRDPISSKDLSPSPTPPTPPPTGPVWSDALLRNYMDDPSDVRDLLLVVNDKSGVVPVGNDHPIMVGLFEKERVRVGELERGLDDLLNGWLERKRRGRV